jgi:hypothetical protein
VVHGSFCFVMSRAAATTGLTVGLFSRALFGYRGAAIATLALALTGTWFAVFEGSVLAVAAQAQFGGPVQLWYAVVTACAVPLAIGGCGSGWRRSPGARKRSVGVTATRAGAPPPRGERTAGRHRTATFGAVVDPQTGTRTGGPPRRGCGTHPSRAGRCAGGPRTMC